MRKQTELWETKDKRKIRFCDMSDSHLINTKRFLEKNMNCIHSKHLLEGYEMLNILNGDMAILSVEQAIGRLEEEDPDYYNCPQYVCVMNEIERRKLNVI